MFILYCVGDTPNQWNCAEWRCSLPARAINQTPGNKATMVRCPEWAQGNHDNLMDETDVVIIQRDIWGAGFGRAMEWLAAGKRILLDLDDAYTLMPNTISSWKFWFKREATGHDGKPLLLPFDPFLHLKNGAKIVDGVISPSQVIADDWTKYNRAYHAPNYPTVAPYLRYCRDEPHKPLVIGWAGGGSHLLSFQYSNVIPALARVAEKRDVVISIVGDFAIYNQLPIPYKKKLFTSWTFDREAYYQNLSTLDVGIAPLFGQYDKRRSWIKGIEYGLLGIPWLGTDYGEKYQPYSMFPDNLVVNQSKLWEQRLLDIIDNYSAYKARAMENQTELIKLDIHSNVNTLLNVYQGKTNEVTND